jgi:hypothetical protein
MPVSLKVSASPRDGVVSFCSNPNRFFTGGRAFVPPAGPRFPPGPVAGRCSDPGQFSGHCQRLAPFTLGPLRMPARIA